MYLGAAKLLMGDVLAGHRANDVGAGDVHLSGAGHEDEVADGRRVDGPARRGPHNHADLRYDARGHGVARKDLAIAPQALDAFLYTGAAAIVEADNRSAVFEGKVLNLDDLFAGHFGE